MYRCHPNNWVKYLGEEYEVVSEGDDNDALTTDDNVKEAGIEEADSRQSKDDTVIDDDNQVK